MKYEPNVPEVNLSQGYNWPEEIVLYCLQTESLNFNVTIISQNIPAVTNKFTYDNSHQSYSNKIYFTDD